MRLRFNQLPEKDIIKFLTLISEKENLCLPPQTLLSIQRLYKSDIRSMINYMQSNQNLIHDHKVIDISVWKNLTKLLQNKKTYKETNQKLEEISIEYNIEIKNIIKDYLNYIIRYKIQFINKDFLNFVEFIMHLHEPKTEYIKNYFVERLHKLFIL